MASAAQIAANRANAARSTGPLTMQDKERSSRNSLKHGAFAVALLSDENKAGFHALRETYPAICRPASGIQYFLEPDPQPVPLADDPIAEAYIRDSERGNTITKLARYQNTLERSYYLALHELEYRIKSESPDA